MSASSSQRQRSKSKLMQTLRPQQLIDLFSLSLLQTDCFFFWGIQSPSQITHPALRKPPNLRYTHWINEWMKEWMSCSSKSALLLRELEVSCCCCSECQNCWIIILLFKIESLYSQQNQQQQTTITQLLPASLDTSDHQHTVAQKSCEPVQQLLLLPLLLLLLLPDHSNPGWAIEWQDALY